MTARATLIPLALIAATLSAASAQAQPAKPARACFFQRQLNGWKDVGDRQLNVRVGVRDIYQIALDSPCWNLRWAERLGLESRGSSNICTGDTVTVIVPDRATGPDRCFGRVIRRLTPEEAAALPAKQRP